VDELRRAGAALRADAVVVGSGAGGAAAAAEMAAGGMDVVVLEEGARHDYRTFSARPRDMALRLYRDAGQLATIGTPPIVLPLGRAAGGTTLINSGTCFRTPAPVLERWARDHGVAPIEDDVFDHVERVIGVAEVPEALAGRNALIVRRGAQALGLSGGFLRRNAPGCRGSGVCAFGCPSGAKQHAAASWLPRAEAAGARVLTGVAVRRVVVRGGRAHGVEARGLTVHAPIVVVACGALLTPGLLRRSGVRSRALGRHLTIHPASAARARFDEPIDPWDGVPQSYYVDALAGEGIMLEGIAGPPDQAALATPGDTAEHRAWMLDVRSTASFGVMVADSATGTVREAGGRLLVRYDLHATDAERLRRGFALLADIWWAAGAREIVVPIAGVPVLRGGDSGPLRAARVRPRDVKAMAFHPLGTARAGANPGSAVVDPQLRVHGVRGLYVADGSVVPSSPQVNPQVTIMALAVRLGRALARMPA
jgi:choline dehydrogenase-like flavoprotein